MMLKALRRFFNKIKNLCLRLIGKKSKYGIIFDDMSYIINMPDDEFKEKIRQFNDKITEANQK